MRETRTSGSEGGGGEPNRRSLPLLWRTWIPAFEAVIQSHRRWISALRPSTRPLRGRLRMRQSDNASNSLPHAEEPPQAASRSTHGAPAALAIRFPYSLLRRDDDVRESLPMDAK